MKDISQIDHMVTNSIIGLIAGLIAGSIILLLILHILEKIEQSKHRKWIRKQFHIPGK